ncbi:MAG: Trp family transcriptional regulator [Spirochaetia bacterium]
MNESDNYMPYLDELSTAFAECTDKTLIRDFLESLLTPNEIQEVSTRWALVRMIDQGLSQRNIANQLGLSLCKITRGSRELKKEDSPFKEMINLYKKIEPGEG